MAYTTIDDPSVYFQTALYTGNNSNRDITNDGNSDLQPDWIWGKGRSESSDPTATDSSRGNTKVLTPSDNSAEGTASDYVTAFNSDGFSLGSNNGMNKNTVTYVAWQWKANGGSTTTNDASATSVGTIDSVYQANTTAGFSIVTFTGNGSSGATVAHGLGAVPKTILIKSRNGTNKSWNVYHSSIDATDAAQLDTTAAFYDSASYWNDTEPTSTVFSLGNSSETNESGKNFVVYCFAEIQGYSKFGSYVGNGDDNGPFVYTGFKPAWVLYKRSSDTGNWRILDKERNTFNPINNEIYADLANAEAQDTQMDFLSNGFKLRNGSSVGQNGNNSTYIYWAFAEHPFVSSEGVPVTAR